MHLVANYARLRMRRPIPRATASIQPHWGAVAEATSKHMKCWETNKNTAIAYAIRTSAAYRAVGDPNLAVKKDYFQNDDMHDRLTQARLGQPGQHDKQQTAWTTRTCHKSSSPLRRPAFDQGMQPVCTLATVRYNCCLPRAVRPQMHVTIQRYNICNKTYHLYTC